MLCFKINDKLKFFFFNGWLELTANKTARKSWNVPSPTLNVLFI